MDDAAQAPSQAAAVRGAGGAPAARSDRPPAESPQRARERHRVSGNGLVPSRGRRLKWFDFRRPPANVVRFSPAAGECGSAAKREGEAPGLGVAEPWPPAPGCHSAGLGGCPDDDPEDLAETWAGRASAHYSRASARPDPPRASARPAPRVRSPLPARPPAPSRASARSAPRVRPPTRLADPRVRLLPRAVIQSALDAAAQAASTNVTQAYWLTFGTNEDENQSETVSRSFGWKRGLCALREAACVGRDLLFHNVFGSFGPHFLSHIGKSWGAGTRV